MGAYLTAASNKGTKSYLVLFFKKERFQNVALTDPYKMRGAPI
jgi:hypothetical protein